MTQPTMAPCRYVSTTLISHMDDTAARYRVQEHYYNPMARAASSGHKQQRSQRFLLLLHINIRAELGSTPIITGKPILGVRIPGPVHPSDG